MTTTYTYRELQSELKRFRDELGYTLEVKLNASAVDLRLELDRITVSIEESGIDEEDMYDETDDETETNEELELVETLPRSTHEKALVEAKYYADKYIICDDSNEMNYTYAPITKIKELTYRNQPIHIDGFVNKKLEMMERITKETFLNLNLNRVT